MRPLNPGAPVRMIVMLPQRPCLSVQNWITNIQETIFNPACVLCRAPASLALDLCQACQADLPRQRHACSGCALSLSADSDTGQCRRCLRKPRFDAALAAFEYTSPVDWLITRLKFHNRLSHARLLGALLAGRVARADAAPADCIVPMPLHPRRYRERGYNQAALIAGHTARAQALPVMPDLAVRTRNTPPQLSLPKDERRRNVRNAFSASGECSGRHIAIVDDVVTTGHTAGALAAALKRGGAASVQLWCIARA